MDVVTPEITQNMTFSPIESGCYLPYAAYDIGSGATKYMGAIVNVCSLDIDQVFAQGAIPVPYRMDLIHSESNEFSDLIQEMGLETLMLAKRLIQKEYDTSGLTHHGDLQQVGVATAAFREALNGQEFAEHIHQKLEISVRIISQEDEGILAYYGALNQLEGTDLLETPIVWDIGGGSMQLTAKDPFDTFYMIGTDLASETFYALMMSQVLNKTVDETPYPMQTEEVQATIDLAKETLTFDLLAKEILDHKIAKGSPVLAVGAVHNFLVQPLCNFIVGESSNTFTKAGVLEAIALLTNKTEDQIIHTVPFLDKNFINNQLSSLILVYAMMDKMEIEKVRTVNVNNNHGLILKWAATPIARLAYSG